MIIIGMDDTDNHLGLLPISLPVAAEGILFLAGSLERGVPSRGGMLGGHSYFHSSQTSCPVAVRL